MKTNFEIWRDSDNVVKTSQNGYKTQCGQYKKEHTEDELKAYFIKEYGENNKEYADEIADLFEHYETLPDNVKSIINSYENEENDYNTCQRLIDDLEEVGYTCEFGLDAEPYNLHKLQTTNETPEDMNTTEKNILIAEFLQVDKNENGTFELPQHCKMTLGGTFKTEFQVSQLKYNSDWNWIMEVVEKIETLTDINSNGCFMVLESIGFNAKFIFDDGTRILKDSKGETKIEAVYNAVVEFIKWHNEQKN